ncbi:hypothetical protein S7711_01632 [Stachybotrys chartarum IBT 7711]|uniref:Cytochrome P450 n=1 Tax=Stachybotrys chartarum (strain CBS 109288 / IBT 7711) TaxID=1280523 RepID=A0A084BCB2_STACB|nr:hypothetical protein S7711_01632 [Stachybotrys chartarum IBT 7711]
MFAPPLFVVGAALLLVYVVFRRAHQHRRGPLPPGPSGLPLIGNIKDLPPPGIPEWTHWLKHKDLYGPISSVTALGQTIIILHDREAVFEILEKRALKNSSRPNLVFANDVVGYRDMMVMMPYDREYRLQRKMAATQVGNKSIIRFEPVQEFEVLRFLKRVHVDPANLRHHLHSLSGSVMLRILYNYKTDPDKKDPLVIVSNKVMDEFSKATSPGTWMVDLIPWLRYVPEWFPGAEFKKTAKLWRDHLMHSVYDPYDFVVEQMNKGNDDLSYLAGLIGDVHRPISEEEKTTIGWSAAGLFNAGTDTTSGTLHAFIMAMILFPEVQKRAQEEIDRVVGESRLPTFSDKANLPYLRAVVQEAVRWHTLVPMGFPHLATEDDTYAGYSIPKDSIIIASIGWLMHDPAVYHDPDEFKPERFLEPYNEPLATTVIFGFGRRVCPGRWIAEQTLFLAIAQTLATFTMSKAVDAQGNEIEVILQAQAGILSHLEPFPFQITARSEKHQKLLE